MSIIASDFAAIGAAVVLASVGGGAFLKATLAAFATSSLELTASGMAARWGLHTYLIGAIVVALGTSLTELVTVILARLRSHDDVGVGTLMGSKLSNGLASAAPTLVVSSLGRMP